MTAYIILGLMMILYCQCCVPNSVSTRGWRQDPPQVHTCIDLSLTPGSSGDCTITQFEMPAIKPQRRKQFSSCDACRKSRVACDAMQKKSADKESVATCSRCKSRNRQCTFEVFDPFLDNASLPRH